MRLPTAEFHATGAVRDDLHPDETADITWATNSPDLYTLLIFDRGWTPDRFERWLADAWIRFLLDG